MGMKLLILTNFSYPSIGGCENVIKNISEKLISDFKYDITVASYNIKKNFNYKGVKYARCPANKVIFLDFLSKFEHVFIYSDVFRNFPFILLNVEKIKPRLSIALVGMNFLLSNGIMLEKFKDKKDYFNVLVHSKFYSDYKWCLDNDIDVSVIPNGVDLREFTDNKINFREKYNINNKYIYLNVSNFLPGKGQSALVSIAEKLEQENINYKILSISNPMNLNIEQKLFSNIKKQSINLNIDFLRNIPRSDVIAAFLQSNAFLFTSLKEVCPLVALESIAANLPFISMDVGNLMEYEEIMGEMIIKNNLSDKKNNKIITNSVIEEYIEKIKYVNNKNNFKYYFDVKDIQWDNICNKYDNFFKYVSN